MKKSIAVLLCVLLCMAGGCERHSKKYTPIVGLDTKESVTLTIAIPYETNKALNTVANAFMTRYPNVNVHLQYVEDYDTNAVQLFKDNKVDMIFQKGVDHTEYTVKDKLTGEKIPTGKCTGDYFYNFAQDAEIDFSAASPDISENNGGTYTDAAGNTVKYIYSYPIGGETRGVFVNTSLLESYGLKVPKNYAEFLQCCETLKNNKLVPIQGSVATAAYSLGMAPAINPVVHNDASLRTMAAAEEGVSELFSDTISKFYTLATNRYIDYKAVEQTGYFTMTSEIAQAQSFLGLYTDENTFEVSTPPNNIGYAAFMPYISSMGTLINSLIEEYKLDTEFAFICSPLNDEGAAAAYVTPYYGICANKNSANLIWTREFVNFLFQKEINNAYAEEAGIIPNTTDAMRFTADKYSLSAQDDIALCGQILFSDEYNGFNPIAEALLVTLKGNAPKYMVNLNLDAEGKVQYETDAEGREFLYLGNTTTKVYREYVGEADAMTPGYAFCTIEYYMDNAEKEFAAYRVK